MLVYINNIMHIKPLNSYNIYLPIKNCLYSIYKVFHCFFYSKDKTLEISKYKRTVVIFDMRLVA